jgi:hypothetical protein
MADPKKPILKRPPRIQQRTDLSLIMGLGLLAFFVVVGFMLNIGPRDSNPSNKPSVASSQSR